MKKKGKKEEYICIYAQSIINNNFSYVSYHQFMMAFPDGIENWWDEYFQVKLINSRAYTFIIEAIDKKLLPMFNFNTDKELLSPADKEFENNIRPAIIEDFSGQQQIIDNLRIFIKAARMRNEALDHILFHAARCSE